MWLHGSFLALWYLAPWGSQVDSDSLLPPWHLTDSLAHCWLPGSLLVPLIVGSQSAGLIAGFDSLLPPCLIAGSQGAWLIAGSLTHC